jgi:predicted nucleotidyltransferase component of viral defense system
MKDYLLELISKKEGYNAKLNAMREYLQAYVLRVMHEQGVFRHAAFLGGTALRFLYDLPRFSEDLDFSLENADQLDFARLVTKIMTELKDAGYQASMTYNDRNIVKSAFIKFSGLMFEAEMSAFQNQNFSIKIEMDSNPSQGAMKEVKMINKYFPISFLSYDISSLFAGKLHAILNRRYTKGRDYFDLGWYLSKWKGLQPNLAMLNHALGQTQWPGDLVSKENWRRIVLDVIKKTDWDIVIKDVQNFLERPEDLSILTKNNVIMLLEEKET